MTLKMSFYYSLFIERELRIFAFFFYKIFLDIKRKKNEMEGLKLYSVLESKR